MKKLKFLSITLLVALMMSICSVPFAYAIEEPAPTAKAAVLLDAESGVSLYSKNADEKVYPASTTKIMTALLAIEAVDRGEIGLGDYVTASENSTYGLVDDGSSADIKVGETMTLENLLYCALLQSANEACNIIAEYVAGDIQTFVANMNKRAQELGCTGTNFTNTNGLPDSNHYTTANDFSKIAMTAIKNITFMNICNTPSRIIPSTNKSDERKLQNSNGLINQNSEYGNYLYEGAEGVKTGHTQDAGYCLVSTAKRQNFRLLSVVMGSTATNNADGSLNYNNFSDTTMLYDWAFNNFSYRDILKSTELIEDLPVALSENDEKVSVHPQETIRALLPNDDDLSTLQRKVAIYSKDNGEELVAPIRAGEVLGEITITCDGIEYGTTPLIASSGVDLSYSQKISSHIKKTLTKPVVIVAIVAILILLVMYTMVVIKYRARRKKELEEIERKRRLSSQITEEREKVLEKSTSDSSQKSIQYNDQTEDDISKPLVTKKTKTEVKEKELSSEEQAERDYFQEFFGKK